MIRRLSILPFLLMPAAALAQTAAPSEEIPGRVSPAATAALPPGVVPPQPEGVHICPGYPRRALNLGKSGETTVHFTITTQGTVSDPSVVNSSGDPDLDSAALLCMKAWLFKPATVNGQPVAASWTAVYSWQVEEGMNKPDTPDPARVVTAPQWQRGGFACEDWYTGTSRPAHAVVMTFFVETDGSVKDVTVSQSSGNPDIDNDAIKCLSQRHYVPAKEGDTPIEVHISDFLY